MEYKLTYGQLRDILGLALANQTLRLRIEDLLSGKTLKVSELELLDMIRESQADKDLIRILTGNDPDTLDAFVGLEAIAGFFGYMRANSGKWQTWLGALGYAVAGKATRSKGSK
jgi:hypothetical protein